MHFKLYFLISIMALLMVGCTNTTPKIPTKPTISIDHSKSSKKKKKKKKKHKKTKNILIVTSTAYTSCTRETDHTPYLAAWNNRLKPSVKSIAVSRDLLKLGLTNGTRVKISGLKGHYIVLDKMNKRWKKKIDIYMGRNLKKAIKWGKRKVTIIW